MVSLSEKTAKSISIVSISQVLQKTIGFTSTILIARLLDPTDYGLMAIAMIFVGFFGLFNEMGIGSAVIQSTKLTQEKLSSAFFLVCSFGLACFVLCYFSASLVAQFFTAPLLISILPLLSINLLLGSISSVPGGLLSRNFKFKYLAFANFTQAFLVATISLILAYMNYGVWSLVYGNVIGGIARTIIVLFSSRWWPSIPKSIFSAIPLVKYGLFILLARTGTFFSSQAVSGLIGKFMGAASLGLYSMAGSLSSIPFTHILSKINFVSSPVFAKLQNDKHANEKVALCLQRSSAYLTFPIFIGIILTGHEFVLTVLGGKWIEVVVPMKLLCLGAFSEVLVMLIHNNLILSGYAKAVSILSLFKTLLIILAAGLACAFGNLADIVTSIVVAKIFMFSITLTLMKRKQGFSIYKVFSNLLPTIRNIIIMGLFVFLAGHLASLYALSVPAQFALEVSAGVISYGILNLFFTKTFINDLNLFLDGVGFSPYRFARLRRRQTVRE